MMKQTPISRSVAKSLTLLRNHTGQPLGPALLAVVFLAVAVALPGATAFAQDSETVEHGAGFYYTVKKGDTLWDLSQRFADSPWLWPDLWQRNGQIANPHRIYPGERIRIYHKDWIERMRTQPEPEPEPEPVEVAQAPEPEPEIPAEIITYAAIDSVGFIREYKAGSYGKIFKVEDDKWMISQGDLVYITPEAGELEIGSYYPTIRFSGRWTPCATRTPRPRSATSTICWGSLKLRISRMNSPWVKFTDLMRPSKSATS